MANTKEKRKKIVDDEQFDQSPLNAKSATRKEKDETKEMSAGEVAQTSSLFYLHSLLLICGRLLNGVLSFYHNLFALSSRDKAKIYQNLSTQYLNKGLNQKAVETLKEWSRLDSGNPDAHYHLAVALEAAGKWKQAGIVLNRVVKLNPAHTKALYLKGKIQIKQKNYQDAISILESLLKIDPNAPEVHYLLGVTCNRLDDIEKAIKAMEKACELDPEESKYLQYLGLLYERSGKQKEAAKCFAKVMDLEDRGDEYEDVEVA
ncbi:MAG: magnetosome protein MamA [Thermodesulfobacteriota bacterium]